MATLTEVLAAVVVHSSAAAFSHFGVTLQAPVVERAQPVSERVIARTPRKTARTTADCPEAQQQQQRARIEKV